MAKLAARSLIEVIWAAATRTELAVMSNSAANTREKRERMVVTGWWFELIGLTRA